MPMIRSGRCDECRRRKRKCDEARPACSGCDDRDVRCVYSNEVSKFIHILQPDIADSTCSSDTETPTLAGEILPKREIILNIRSSREPPTGKGLYQTFVPSKNKRRDAARKRQQDPERRRVSISPPPCNDTLKLQNEFHAVLHSASSKGLRMQILGSWLDMCLPRIGASPVLDRAIACLIAGHKARYTSDDRAMRSGRHRYGESLMLLRDTVAGGIHSITGEAIAATKILMLFELLVGTEIHGWISHSYGAINLFLALGPDACKNDFERSLFYATFAQGWQQALMIGKPSVFDKPEWLRIQPGHSLANGTQSNRRLRVITRLPRLTALVRAVRNDPTNNALAAKAVKLAEELLTLDWGADEDWNPQPDLVPTAKNENARLVPVSFRWSKDDFTRVSGLNLWWINRIMLGGLCQSLISCGVDLEWPSLSHLYDEERRCATYIAMSMDYYDSMAPYGSIVSLQFMQTAWGVFWRQKDFPSCVDGYAMSEWLLRRGNVVLRRFLYPKDMTNEGLAFNFERLMGGPILPPEWFQQPEDKNDEMSDDMRQMNRELLKASHPPTRLDSNVDTEDASAFNEGVRNAMMYQQSLNRQNNDSGFAEAVRNQILDYEHLT